MGSDGIWQVTAGHYDMSRERALSDMLSRAGYQS
jgi:hypothetical protein